MNNKIIFFGFGFIIAVIVLAGAFVARSALTGFVVDNTEISEFDFDYIYTTAICDGNTCSDFKVSCKNGEAFDVIPVTGLVVFPDGWEDPRSEKELCG
jgi:hypothetical protein